MMLKVILLLPLLNCCLTAPVEPTKDTLATKDQNLKPENQAIEVPLYLSDLVEVKEDEIANGTWVVAVEESLDKPPEGETLQTAANIVFRPLFRYRERQQVAANRRIRRRYYVPRRSYRPYRSPYYHYPTKFYGYNGFYG